MGCQRFQQHFFGPRNCMVMANALPCGTPTNLGDKIDNIDIANNTWGFIANEHGRCDGDLMNME